MGDRSARPESWRLVGAAAALACAVVLVASVAVYAGPAQAGAAPPDPAVGQRPANREPEQRLDALERVRPALEEALGPDLARRVLEQARFALERMRDVGLERQERALEQQRRALAQAREALERARGMAWAGEPQALARLRQALAATRPGGPQHDEMRVFVDGLRRGPDTSSGPLVRWILGHTEELELSDAQVEQIRQAWREHRRAEIQRQAQIETAELDLEEMLREPDDADPEAVQDKMMAVARLRVEGRVAGLRLRQRVMDMLDADQRAKLRERMPEGPSFGWSGGPPGRLFAAPGRFEFHGGDDAFEIVGPDRGLRVYRWRLRHRDGEEADELHEHHERCEDGDADREQRGKDAGEEQGRSGGVTGPSPAASGSVHAIVF